MTEKEREDIVEFDGGDFAPEDVDGLRQRTISQSSADSSWGEGSSVSHDAATPLATAADSRSKLESASHDTHGNDAQDELDQEKVDSETLLEAAKGEPEAIETVAQEDPTSSVVDPAATSATPKKDPGVDADSTPTNHRRRPSESSTAATTTPSASRRGSLRQRHVAAMAMDPVKSSSSSSLGTTDSEQAVDRSLTPSKPRKRRSARSSAVASARASETEESRGWIAPRNGNADSATANRRGAVPSRRKTSSAKRAIRRTFLALRDFLLAVLLSPVNCIRFLRRRRAVRAEEAVEAIYERAQVPILEKTNSDEPTPTRTKRPPSLRFASKTELQRDPEKRSGNASRPRTPKPDEKDHTFQTQEEPVTEDQAAALGTVWKSLALGQQRTPSRLLPNPQVIDPMLAHNSKAEPIDVVMAEKEAVMEAERQSRIAKGRAARRAAAIESASDARSSPTPQASSLLPSKVPRAPASSVIHHSPKILVLDLDETLIHSTSRSPSHLSSSGRTTTSGFLGLETAGAFLGLRANDNPRRIRPHMVEVVLDGRSVLYHVYKRPWTDYFLRKVSSWYTVVVFTASVQEYADPVIDWLDQGRGLISARLFRESCSFSKGSYVKNLKVVDEDLSKVCLVDNSPASYRLNRENGIPVEGWTSDPNDEALLDLLPVLDSLRFASDVRHILGIRGW
ncbi:phosphatase [Pseudozyma hubeiensis SY62]|uniref:Phosphatase n=1 Tax=Pseudozyma hubeiensis (strain SY62) TaxID=1305764 RepID=R9PE59_PSEHS|nr:phosphatase [Pseudozyma hubeiensis SY62]GAC99646.1 phosphatase [Pseudozyma hubeiensis SY62]